MACVERKTRNIVGMHIWNVVYTLTCFYNAKKNPLTKFYKKYVEIYSDI